MRDIGPTPLLSMTGSRWMPARAGLTELSRGSQAPWSDGPRGMGTRGERHR